MIDTSSQADPRRPGPGRGQPVGRGGGSDSRRDRPGRRPGGRIIAGVALIAIVPIAWFGWREWDPPVLVEAAAALRRGDLESARRKAAAHLASRPFSRAGALIAARSLAGLGRVEEAESHYRRAGRLDDDVLHQRALALVRARLNKPAIEVYEEILARSPGDVVALRRMAVSQILLSRWDDALATAGQLARTPGGAVIGHTLAGVVYHDTDRPDASVPEFERVLALDPDLLQMPLDPKAQFWVYLSQDLLRLGRGADARPYLARALDRGEDAYLLDMLGTSYWQEGEIEDAERRWLRSIELNPRRPHPWLMLGNLELQRNRLEPAVERLGRAAALAPTAREPFYGLSLACGRLGRRDEADRYRAIAERLRAEIQAPPRVMGESKSR